MWLNTTSPPADNKWCYAIYAAVLTCGDEVHDAQVCDDDAEGRISLGMRVASSTQSIWDPHLIVPLNSPMIGGMS